jgi:NAD+ synthase (glutamine-hydrolysing)
MAQINSTVGDFEGNTRKILEAIAGSKSLGIDLITFPELAVCGYPPEDLLLKPHFIEKNLLALREIAGECRGITAVIGFVDRDDGIYNAAAIIHKGRVIDIYHKIHLPNYGVFDEYRYFKPGQRYPVYNLGGISIGINICEDIWCQFGPTHYQTAAGAELIINISASPYYFRRLEDRRQMLSSRARDNIAIVAYNNLVGGQDELVFDGGSMVFDESGQLIASGRQFVEELIITDLDTSSIAAKRRASPGWPRQSDSVEPEPATPQITIAETLPVHSQAEITTQLAAPLEPEAEIYQALVLGTGDYVRKNGFQKVLIGLSGGIDSSLVAAIAVDALGAANVIGIAMPSQYSSTGRYCHALPVLLDWQSQGCP